MKVFLMMLALLALAKVAMGIKRALESYFKFRQGRTVACPWTNETARVRVAAGDAAVNALIGDPGMASLVNIKLSQCTRWPLKQDCGQRCLTQIREALNPQLLVPSNGVLCEECGPSAD